MKTLIKVWRYSAVLLLLIYIGFTGPWMISEPDDMLVIVGLITGMLVVLNIYKALTYKPRKNHETSSSSTNTAGTGGMQ
jgi:hypothetical protein